MTTEATIGLVAVEVASDLLMAYFRLLDTSGMTPEQKEAHYQETRARYYSSIQKPAQAPPE